MVSHRATIWDAGRSRMALRYSYCISHQQSEAEGQSMTRRGVETIGYQDVPDRGGLCQRFLPCRQLCLPARCSSLLIVYGKGADESLGVLAKRQHVGLPAAQAVYSRAEIGRNISNTARVDAGRTGGGPGPGRGGQVSPGSLFPLLFSALQGM